MDLSKLRVISNLYQDVRLLSLSHWRNASQIDPCDHGGPYVVVQEGCAPHDFTYQPDEFVLGRSGKWLSLGMFFQLPVEARRGEFVFGTVAEIMQLLENLPTKATTLNPNEISGVESNQGTGGLIQDDLNAAVQNAPRRQAEKPRA